MSSAAPQVQQPQLPQQGQSVEVIGGGLANEARIQIENDQLTVKIAHSDGLKNFWKLITLLLWGGVVAGCFMLADPTNLSLGVVLIIFGAPYAILFSIYVYQSFRWQLLTVTSSECIVQEFIQMTGLAPRLTREVTIRSAFWRTSMMELEEKGAETIVIKRWPEVADGIAFALEMNPYAQDRLMHSINQHLQRVRTVGDPPPEHIVKVEQPRYSRIQLSTPTLGHLHLEIPAGLSYVPKFILSVLWLIGSSVLLVPLLLPYDDVQSRVVLVVFWTLVFICPALGGTLLNLSYACERRWKVDLMPDHIWIKRFFLFGNAFFHDCLRTLGVFFSGALIYCFMLPLSFIASVVVCLPCIVCHAATTTPVITKAWRWATSLLFRSAGDQYIPLAEGPEEADDAALAAEPAEVQLGPVVQLIWHTPVMLGFSGNYERVLEVKGRKWDLPSLTMDEQGWLYSELCQFFAALEDTSMGVTMV